MQRRNNRNMFVLPCYQHTSNVLFLFSRVQLLHWRQHRQHASSLNSPHSHVSAPAEMIPAKPTTPQHTKIITSTNFM
jgi:hypothetical protein